MQEINILYLISITHKSLVFSYIFNIFQKQEIKGSDLLDHLGLIAATIDSLGISKEIDKRLPLTKIVKTPKFFENKPIVKLFGANLKAEGFNDDALSRCLDAIHDYVDLFIF